MTNRVRNDKRKEEACVERDSISSFVARALSLIGAAGEQRSIAVHSFCFQLLKKPSGETSVNPIWDEVCL